MHRPQTTLNCQPQNAHNITNRSRCCVKHVATCTRLSAPHRTAPHRTWHALIPMVHRTATHRTWTSHRFQCWNGFAMHRTWTSPTHNFNARHECRAESRTALGHHTQLTMSQWFLVGVVMTAHTTISIHNVFQLSYNTHATCQTWPWPSLTPNLAQVWTCTKCKSL